ncbi:Hypothetical predicted protein [Paramuricea clavata]|uniref:Uncharacterized protein n=1 Tax=Paramuricea clavata TaxID=317549 RepID=A0A7D9EZ64_PARCT|nr:Hypothetical predicted protein [Paramuricea clavata]
MDFVHTLVSLPLAVTYGVPQGSILGPLMFVVFINDLDIALKKTKLIFYADDTVVYYSGKTSEEIIKILNDDLQELGKWFKKNNLVINMKKGKTEFVLYGTAKRIAIQQPSGEQINVTICGENVNQSASYDYLGVTLDSDERQSCHKLQNLQERANKIIFGKKARNTWIPLKNRREMDVAITTFKCIHDLSPLASCLGFSKLNQGKNTRGNGMNLVLPKVRTESGKKTFAFQGTKLYNKLTRELKEERSLLLFKSKLKLFYS